MQKRDDSIPAGAEDLDERGRRDHLHPALRTRAPLGIARRRPTPDFQPEDQQRFTFVQHEDSFGKILRAHIVHTLRTILTDSLAMELLVDGVSSRLLRVECAPKLAEPDVVLVTAQRARAVSGRERCRLVQEEQLGELPRLQERQAVPTAELEPAGDPPPAVVAPPDPTLIVVETSAVAVDKAARGVRDQLTARRDPVAERHLRKETRSAADS